MASMSFAQYLLPALLEFALPLMLMLAGVVAMRRTGMLPAQVRLDQVLKDTIQTMQDRIEMLEKNLQDSQTQTQATKASLAALEQQHKEEMADKDAAIAALQRALAREQHAGDQLREKVAEAERKIAALQLQSRDQQSQRDSSGQRRDADRGGTATAP